MGRGRARKKVMSERVRMFVVPCITRTRSRRVRSTRSRPRSTSRTCKGPSKGARSRREDETEQTKEK